MRIYAAGTKWLQTLENKIHCSSSSLVSLLLMNDANIEIQRFRNLLITRKQELLKADETGGQAEQVVELDQTRVGRLSRMDAMQAQAMSLETGRRRRLIVVDIDAALARLEAGEFGECFECGLPINPMRLEADPTATLCIGCAEALE
jgi:DnaK suppressor protein